MITKIKQFFNENTSVSAINKLTLALSDLKLIVNDTNFMSQLQISNRLKHFFTNDQTKILFLNQLLQVVGDHLQQKEKFYVKLKMLLLVHIIISSQVYLILIFIIQYTQLQQEQIYRKQSSIQNQLQISKQMMEQII